MLRLNSRGLDAVINGGPAHLSPLAAAVRDCDVDVTFIIQSPKPFCTKQRNRPRIFVLGDDCASALGPESFHMPSVRRAIRSCAAFSVVSCEPLVQAYVEPASVAVALRKNAMIVETRLEQEAAWYNLIQKLAPNRPILLATVKGGRA